MASNKSIKENKKLSVDDNGYFKVSLDTFLYNAGIVGFIQVLENAKAERDKDYIINGQDLSISKKFLKKSDLSQLYIDSMIKKFGDKTRIYKTIQYIEHIINSKEIEEENFKEEMNFIIGSLEADGIKTSYKVLKKYKIPINIEENINEVKNIIKDKSYDINEIKKYLQKILNDFKNDKIKQNLLMKNIIYNKIKLFWKDKAFLSKNNSDKDLKEVFNNSFEEPLKNMIEDKKEYKYNCITCDTKIQRNIDTTFLFEVGVDTNRKKSAFWNCNPDSFICPLCNFIYACSPMGFIEIGNNNLVFVNYNDSIEYLIKMNASEEFKEDIKSKNEKYLFYNKIIQIILSIKTKELNSFQVITRNDKHYSSNIIGKDALQVIQTRKSDLKFISNFSIKTSNDEYINMFEECLDNILNFRNQWLLIFKVLKNDNKNNRVIYSVLFSILQIQITQKNIHKKGGIMKKKINLSYFAGKSGDEMRKIIIGVNNDMNLSDEQNKEADNKLRGLVYQLINSVYTNNKDIFFSNITRLYTGMNIVIPTIFTNIFEDDEYFKEIGFAYILGLKGAYDKDAYDNKENKKEKGENN
ncbi:Cas8a1 family CRISPR/Cas system-associated protein [Brachyspira aalborgi]|uniref:CRISPR-associated protein CXXC-CXXC domain-containing protein n=1 Tax=Brachyspira aalborgi TaxID=29522 RepID=A0A5C8EGC7_9SPIR|nr:Cas8a1 family CRISPR/Cas system-associated protein [Brachyspira aalborgi]TXJ36783.1 hypothetical protein EPJ81_10630 [Brachyspira aalborgi]